MFLTVSCTRENPNKSHINTGLGRCRNCYDGGRPAIATEECMAVGVRFDAKPLHNQAPQRRFLTKLLNDRSKTHVPRLVIAQAVAAA
jgi:hypothetical protein